jgi:hypothetical protein
MHEVLGLSPTNHRGLEQQPPQLLGPLEILHRSKEEHMKNLTKREEEHQCRLMREHMKNLLILNRFYQIFSNATKLPNVKNLVQDQKIAPLHM